MLFLRIDGETPAKKNSRINTRSGRSFPSKKYQDWHKTAVNVVKLQNNVVFAPISSPVKIEMIFIHGDKRRRDSDNGCSSILDTLVDAGVLFDDCYEIVKELSIKNEYEKNNAHCDIKIMTL